MNRVVLCGRLAARPRQSHTADGTAVSEFRLSVPRGDPTSGTPTEEIECIAYRELAQELNEWGERSHRLNLEGKLRYGPFPTAPQARQRLYVVADRAYFIDPVKCVPNLPTARAIALPNGALAGAAS